MNEFDKLRAVTARREGEREEGRQRYRASSKERLLRIIQRKFRTAFIGALARFEEAFGEIWGHGKQDSECTPEQRAMREKWEQCRTEVLNNGNHQLRAVEKELQQYDVNWNRNQYVLRPSATKEE